MPFQMIYDKESTGKEWNGFEGTVVRSPGCTHCLIKWKRIPIFNHTERSKQNKGYRRWDGKISLPSFLGQRSTHCWNQCWVKRGYELCARDEKRGTGPYTGCHSLNEPRTTSTWGQGGHEAQGLQWSTRASVGAWAGRKVTAMEGCTKGDFTLITGV